MARRKRIPYDPPGNRKKRRRRGPIPRADQIFLSRRMFVAKGAVVTAFTALAGKLGFMQVVQHANYRQQAQNNVLWPVLLKAPRGLVYDRANRMLADNRRSWEVRVVPDKLPADPVERDAVVDRISAELGLPDTLVINPAEVPTGSDQTVYAGVLLAMQAAGVVGVRGPDATPEEWMAFITREANPNRNYLLLLADDLSVDQAAQLRAVLPGLPGVKVMNRLRYAIGNTGNPQAEVVAKSDVPREVALKLEANKLYLPGLVLDDTVLVRRYLGGETMSHVLGFARKVDEEALNAPENQDQFGKPVYKLDDIIGVDGLEYTYEERLRGKKGLVTVEVDTYGVEQRKLLDTQKDPQPGQNLKLTIDLDLQAAITQALADGITFSNEDRKAKAEQGKAKPLKYPAQKGAVVAIDPRNGEVLALVSYPLYDNQLFVEGISTRKYQEYTAKDRGEPLLNKAIAGEYPPGSTLKTFLAASALNDKKISRTTSFTCTGEIKVPYDWDESKGTFHRCWL
ncbi:MAG: penicillin-binding transpeptidase domain-containing protein, partial [Chloroflexota bacterium]|nr:penicillin-binding transpeptidase domain-containing protein [Chloroflexota bacterium]